MVRGAPVSFMPVYGVLIPFDLYFSYTFYMVIKQC